MNLFIASLLRGLKHANIVTLHDIVHTRKALILVFEYVDTDLSQYLEHHPGGLSPRTVSLFMFQLLRGLSFCHERRILHRDLKPQVSVNLFYFICTFLNVVFDRIF